MKKFKQIIKINDELITTETTHEKLLNLLDSIIKDEIEFKGITKNQFIKSINNQIDDYIYQTNNLNTKFLKKLSAIYRKMETINGITENTREDIIYLSSVIKGAQQHLSIHKTIDEIENINEKHKQKNRN